jgi:uncharacterized protein YdeI (YjbR/CyaY-like superfamily)
MNAKVDAYINGLKNWKEEVQHLRAILLTTELEEDFKWGRPCYTFNGKNLVGLTPLKDHCALNIFNGAYLTDPNELLILPSEHTQSGRWMKFTTISDIKKKTPAIKAFMKEAISLELSGPIKEKAKLKKAFNALTPGRQRAYLIYFTGSKNAQTIINRIEKFTPKILCGKGFNDCTCGLSKRMPNCDGSHKFAKQ